MALSYPPAGKFLVIRPTEGSPYEAKQVRMDGCFFFYSFFQMNAMRLCDTSCCC